MSNLIMPHTAGLYRLHGGPTAKRLAAFCCGCVRQELADTVEKGKNELIKIFTSTPVETDFS
jgi:hypothetical protein